MKLQDGYDRIFVTTKYGRPYVYFLFFQRYPPESYWNTREIERDWFGFWNVSGFDKYSFNGLPKENKSGEKWLLVADPEGMPQAAKTITSVAFPNGEPAFVIGEL